MSKPFTKDLRNDILLRRSKAIEENERVKLDELARHPDRPDFDRLDAASEPIDYSTMAYMDGLHWVYMSTCPYCNEPLVYSFDPFAMDGDWWSGSRPEPPTTCPHYCFLRGAVSFGDRRPRPPASPLGPARPGPEVPYVIPNKIELPGMIAVIGELPMDPGWRAFPIAYFADPKPAANLLTSSWGASSYSYTNPVTKLGETGYPNDPWDFDLALWIARGKLRWCEPGSGNRRLAAPSEPCPYVGLPGVREAIEVDSTFGFRKVGTPDGSTILPFE
jgi:hypothetical protein